MWFTIYTFSNTLHGKGHLPNGFAGGDSGKEPTCQCRRHIRNTVLIPGLGKSPGRGHGIHSSIPAWRIPWTEEPGGLQSTGLQRVRHNWVSNTHTQLPRNNNHVLNCPFYTKLKHMASDTQRHTSIHWWNLQSDLVPYPEHTLPWNTSVTRYLIPGASQNKASSVTGVQLTYSLSLKVIKENGYIPGHPGAHRMFLTHLWNLPPIGFLWSSAASPTLRHSFSHCRI